MYTGVKKLTKWLGVSCHLILFNLLGSPLADVNVTGVQHITKNALQTKYLKMYIHLKY